MLNKPVPEEPQPLQDPATELSKRAARRIIQRAFILTGRDKPLRQQIRESEIITLWIIEDWELEWSVYIRRGKFEVERRPSKHPDVTLTWPTAEEFFQQVDRSGDANVKVQILPVQEQRRFFETLLRGFFACLRQVLANPVDGGGESLL
ncbi:MAG: hypothetical protein P4N24_20190 [Acidobacteriota bacterium]|jgi:hypothetical protein|nr:hypothetical protein [Acidobacteriota bacterium]